MPSSMLSVLSLKDLALKTNSTVLLFLVTLSCVFSLTFSLTKFAVISTGRGLCSEVSFAARPLHLLYRL